MNQCASLCGTDVAVRECGSHRAPDADAAIRSWPHWSHCCECQRDRDRSEQKSASSKTGLKLGNHVAKRFVLVRTHPFVIEEFVAEFRPRRRGPASSSSEISLNSFRKACGSKYRDLHAMGVSMISSPTIRNPSRGHATQYLSSSRTACEFGQ